MQKDHASAVVQAAQQRSEERTIRIHREYGICSVGFVTNEVRHLVVGDGIGLHKEPSLYEVIVIGANIEDQERQEDQWVHLPHDQDQEKRQGEQEVIGYKDE